MVAGRCPGSGGAACLVAGPAVDGGVVGTAGFFHRPAAGGAKRPEPAGRADRPHRHRLLCAGAGRRPRLGRWRALHGSAGGNGGQRGRQYRADGTFLPQRGPPLLRYAACLPPAGAGKAPLGHPLAGGGRTLSRQRSPHRGEYAGAGLPGSLSAVFRRACRSRGPVRQPQGDGPASADLSLRTAGEPFRPADARDHSGPPPGPERAAGGSHRQDAPAHRLFLGAGRGGVLGVVGRWPKPSTAVPRRAATSSSSARPCR